MTQPKHSPAPWKSGRNVIAADSTVICTVNRPLGGDARIEESNARLIAAAPDLLASLKEMVAGLLATASLGLNEDEVARLQRAEAAISRAEGRSNA